MSQPFHLIVVPDLRAEGFVSMDLYAQEYREILEQEGANYPQMSWEFVDFPDERGQSKWLKAKRKFWDLPREIRRRVKAAKKAGKRVVVHILDHSYGNLVTTDFPCVITCHDLAHLRITDWGASANSLSRKLFEKKVLNMKHAAHIITDSENSYADIEEFIDIPLDRVSVIYHGRNPFYSVQEGSDKDPLLEKVDELAKGRKIILHCGHNAERKNIRVMLQTLKLLLEKRSDICLMKVGRKMEQDEPSLLELIKELGIGESVIELGFIDDEALRAMYHRAEVFFFPSRYEGFGRPILEAQGCELPVVSASSSSLTEVAGEAALFADPDKPEEFAQQLERLLDDQGLRYEMITKGLKNIERFSWQKHLAEAVPVYERVAN